MGWREIWEVMARFRAPGAKPFPHQSVYHLSPKDSSFPNLPNCFRIPIRLGVRPYMPVQVIGKLPKFITKSIQRQSILISECINLPSNTFPSHLWHPRSWALSLLIPRHPYTYWLKEAPLPIPFNWQRRQTVLGSFGSRTHYVNCRLQSSD